MFYNFIFLTTIFIAQDLSSQPVVKVELGSDHVFTHKGIHHLRFHRKGIAEALNVDEGTAKVVCLKPGIVSIHFVDEMGDLRDKQVLECLPLMGKLETGVTDSFQDWLQKRSLCKKECIFNLKLSQKGQDDLRKWLSEKLPSHYYFEVNSTQLRVYVPCPDKNKTQISGADIYCKNTQDKSYLIQMRMIMKQNDQQSLYEPGIHRVSPTQAHVFFSKLSEDHTSEIIAEPRSLISLGGTSELETGGEFPELTEQGHTTQWKKFGLKVTNSLQKNMNGLALTAHYVLSFKDGRSLKTHELKTDIPISLDQHLLLGEGEILSQNDDKSHPFGLENIPIFSPLFRGSKSQKKHLKIQYWVHVTDADTTWSTPM